MKDNTYGWLVVALLLLMLVLIPGVDYNHAESECQAALEENNDE